MDEENSVFNFHAFGNIFEFDGKFEAWLSRLLSSGFISDFIRDELKIPVYLVWKYQITRLYKMEKNVFIGNTLLLNLISVHNLETMKPQIMNINHCQTLIYHVC